MWPALADSPLTLLIAGIALGLVQTFWGYRLFKLTLAILGFVILGLLSANLAETHLPSQWAPLIAGLIGGCLGAALLPALYFLGVFLAGGFFGAVLGLSLGALLSPLAGQVLAAVLALIAAIVAVKAQKIMIVLSTAFGGAWLALASASTWPDGRFDPAALPERMLLAGFAAWLVLGLAGSLVQWGSDRSRSKARAAEPAPTRG